MNCDLIPYHSFSLSSEGFETKTIMATGEWLASASVSSFRTHQ